MEQILNEGKQEDFIAKGTRVLGFIKWVAFRHAGRGKQSVKGDD